MADEPVIADLRVESSAVVLGPTLASDLAADVRAERLPVSHETTTWFHVTVATEDFPAFEQAVADDPTVAEAEAFAAYDSTHRTYRLTIAEDVPVMTEHVAALGEELLDLRRAGDGWRIRLRVIDRDSIRAFAQFCAANEIDFTLDRVFQTADPVGSVPVPVATDDAELLETALEAGYFDVPRETTLEELATEFDVAESTLSVRLRRAVRHVLDQSLAAGDT